MRKIYLSLILFGLTCCYADYCLCLPRDLEIKFLDVGQGDSIYIRTPYGRTVLIDGGPGTSLLERLGEESSFWQKKFDLVVLTHPDLDHLEGLVEILKRYEVDQVLLTAVSHNSSLYRAFWELLEKNNISLSIADPGQDWRLDRDIYLDILAPLQPVVGQEVDNANNASVVACLVYGGTKMLLVGDAEVEAEHELLLSPTDLRVQILKAGHHGSRSSSGLSFLQASETQSAIIMSGKDNSFAHPHLDSILKFDELKINWLDTKKTGTIVVSSDGEKWTLLTTNES